MYTSLAKLQKLHGSIFCTSNRISIFRTFTLSRSRYLHAFIHVFPFIHSRAFTVFSKIQFSDEITKLIIWIFLQVSELLWFAIHWVVLEFEFSRHKMSSKLNNFQLLLTLSFLKITIFGAKIQIILDSLLQKNTILGAKNQIIFDSLQSKITIFSA